VSPRDPITDVALGANSRQLLTTIVGRWRRDWSPSWSSEAQLGLLVIAAASSDPTVATRSAWQPSALAAIRWSKATGSAELRYAHDALPNPYIAQTLSVDAVTLQGGLPIVRAHMTLGATAGYQHARMLSVTAGVPDASANVVVADATVGWQPIRELTLFARYAYFRQLGQAPIDDVPATLPSLRRTTVMIGATFVYPASPKPRVATGPSSRVDATDQAAFPELHSPQPR
jgi:hypothetical protein